MMILQILVQSRSFNHELLLTFHRLFVSRVVTVMYYKVLKVYCRCGEFAVSILQEPQFEVKYCMDLECACTLKCLVIGRRRNVVCDISAWNWKHNSFWAEAVMYSAEWEILFGWTFIMGSNQRFIIECAYYSL